MNYQNYHDALAEMNETTYSTLDDVILDIYDKLHLSVAIFDEDHICNGICMNAKRCKCYYMLLHNEPNHCSIFNQNFTNHILAKDEVNMLCDYGCRLLSTKVEIHNKLITIILYQYNLETDELEFNPTNSSKYVPLYRGDPNNPEYF